MTRSGRLIAVFTIGLAAGGGSLLAQQAWDPGAAAAYLDGRQQAWFDWPVAHTADGPCLSCHTSLPYLLVRPELRVHFQDASGPTEYEAGLLDTLRTRVRRKSAAELAQSGTRGDGVDAVFSALFFALAEESTGDLGALTRRAFDQLWALQLRVGARRGGWPWFDDRALDPWETAPSPFYAAALVLRAVGATPDHYRQEPAVAERIEELTSYVRREWDGQPLHHRLTALWASTALPGVLGAETRERVIAEALAAQRPDGRWAIDDLGPWEAHAQAAPAGAANDDGSYATAYTAFALRRSGVPADHPQMARALRWLEAHQDPAGGYWAAGSMNKPYPDASMEVRFMQDAATAYAALALLSDD